MLVVDHAKTHSGEFPRRGFHANSNYENNIFIFLSVIFL